MQPRLAIINYGMGNLRSVEKALERVGAEAEITADPAVIEAADGLILPGVGAFPKAMARIREAGFDEIVRARAEAGTPVLGVCLGMQLLFDSSSELGGAEGLGLLPGEVVALDAPGLKVPHIGWAEVRRGRPSDLDDGIAANEPFYFVHSFVARAGAEQTLGTAFHGERFAAIVGSGRVFGAQFHPEKSSAAGLRLLRNFTALCVASGAEAR